MPVDLQERLQEQLRELPRHDRLPDLLSHATDKHVRKTRRIEWVGQVSPLDNPLIAFRLINGLYTKMQEQAIRKAAAEARTRGHGHRIRLLESDQAGAQVVFKGLSQTYIFSPKNDYICDVAFQDVDVILGSNVGDEFRDLDDPNHKPDPRSLLPREDSIVKMQWQERVLTEDREAGIIGLTVDGK